MKKEEIDVEGMLLRPYKIGSKVSMLSEYGITLKPSDIYI